MIRTNWAQDALTVANTLLSKDWRVLHIAGHGEPPEREWQYKQTKLGDVEQKDGDLRGMVLSVAA